MIGRSELLKIAYFLDEEELEILDVVLSLMPGISLPEPIVCVHGVKQNEDIATTLDMKHLLTAAAVFLRDFNYDIADVYLRAACAKVY